MRAFIKNYMDALKKQREERGEDADGFSLIELIVVVVILGILIAIAIPIFFGLQDTAKDNARAAAAANGATQVAAQIASGSTASAPASTDQFSFSFPGGTPTTVDGVCVRATDIGGTETADAGPGC